MAKRRTDKTQQTPERRRTKAPVRGGARRGGGDGDGNPSATVPTRVQRGAASAETAPHIPEDLTPATIAANDAPPLVAFPVVGIGASAGGLDAFTRILKGLPANPRLAVVIVQHLAPEYESALPILLGSSSHLPVVQVAEGMQLEVNRVYVIPPDRNMALGSDGRFALVARQERRLEFLPIDFFFHSLAAYARERAIGVVLSGDLSDGAFGIKEIKGAGGITFAQDPSSASRGEMPRSAIATGLVDRILKPEEIGDELVQIARHPLLQLPGGPAAKSRRRGGAALTGEAARAADAAAEAGLDQEQLVRVFTLLRGATGVDFTHYKLPTIRRRLMRRMVLHKITDLADYVKLIQERPAELQNLYADILINVTRFFREPDSFRVLAEKALPEILAARGVTGDGRRSRRRLSADETEQPLRVWVPGCSTGEEPYSVAITLLERLGGIAMEMPVQVFATDISESAIEHARAGIYPESITADVSPERLRRFFNKADGNYRISKAVRDLCIFARQDLTRDPPFSRLDLIVCRNVLIYLGPILQKRLMQVFHYALNPTGFLMLGTAETIGAQVDLFSVVDKVHRLYIKRTVGSYGGHAEIGAPRSASARTRDGSGALRAGGKIGPVTAVQQPPREASNIQNEVNRILLNRFTPPGVIVDSDLNIVQFRGQTGPFLEPAPGDASLNLLKMVREGLLYGVRTALQEARRANTAIRKEGLRVRHSRAWREVNVEAIPLVASGDGRHFLVVFEDVTERARGDAAPAAEPPAPPAARGNGKRGKKPARRASAPAAKADRAADDEHVARLDFELGASREYLQAIIQDLEAANEELNTVNDEPDRRRRLPAP